MRCRLHSLGQSQSGFTLIEVMVSVVLLTLGLLSVAAVFPQGLYLSLYAKDQTKAAGLSQQEIEDLKALPTAWSTTCSSPPATLNCAVGDYYSTTPNNTQALRAMFTLDNQTYARDVQVQVWAWAPCPVSDTEPGLFGTPGTTGTCPGLTTVTFPGTTPYPDPSSEPPGPYVFHVAAATHWFVRGQTTFQAGGSVNGCVVDGAAVSTGLGCVQVGSLITP